jgi:hypothetical protein
MPDLVTHTAIAHLMRRPSGWRHSAKSDAAMRLMFYLGAMLPDLPSRPAYIVFPSLHDWVVAFHTPVGMLFTCAFLSLLFERPLRKKAFGWLFLGAVLHFAVDCLQKQVTGNNFWLFPFSWKNFGIGLFWAGEAMAFVPVWIALVLLVELLIHWKKSNSARKAIEGKDRKLSGMV